MESKNFCQIILPGYGVTARVNNSHRNIPNDQMSDCVENIPSVIASKAIHFTGNGIYKM